MQLSPSLADFMNKLELGPQGVEDALATIQECASTQSKTLDLQQMGLTDADLKSVSSALSHVSTHVTKLNLFMNELTALPDFISVLHKLEVLEAGCNPLQSIHADVFAKLPQLTEVDIGFSELLMTLPDTFDNIPNLRILHMGNNRIEELPPSLYTCHQLEQLHVYGNCVKQLDVKLGSLTNLRILNVGRNQIKQLPDSLGECAKLEVLHAYENCLSRLPSSIVKLENLKTLNVHSNESMPVPPRQVRCLPGVKATAAFYASINN